MTALLRTLGVLLAALAWLMPAATAHAGGDDAIDRFDVTAVLDADGYLHVTETIVLRFGASSGRHGLERTITIREPDRDSSGHDTGQDMVLRVDQIEVSSPSGAPDHTEIFYDGAKTRTEGLRIRIGDAQQTVTSATATYQISYRVLGLMRSPGGVDQLYWDVTGAQMPQIASASARVEVPGGALQLFCSIAKPGLSADCATVNRTPDGAAQFAVANTTSGEVMTVAVGVQPGLVKNNTPILEPDATAVTEQQLELAGAFGFGSFVLSSLAALVVPLIGWRRVRRNTADLRFAELPPGVLPAPGQAAAEVRGDPRIEIPVSFAPPSVSVAEASYLADGRYDVRGTTATVVSLAVQGALRLEIDAKRIELVDRDRSQHPTQKALLRSLFGSKKKAGASITVAEPGRMRAAHRSVEQVVTAAAEDGAWWARAPYRWLGPIDPDVVIIAVVGVMIAIVAGVVAVVFLGTFGVGIVLVALGALPLVASAAITSIVVRAKSAAGQRSAVGRALTDQVVGFRTYLATAEAEQLQFEEGEDVFSKYLPWAIVFGLTDRWTQVCQRLIAAGRLSPQAPSWYVGPTWDPQQLSLQLNDFAHSVSESTSPPPSTSTGSDSYSASDSGFGSSGSAFSDGGGFSGGGGGGGDAGSW